MRYLFKFKWRAVKSFYTRKIHSALKDKLAIGKGKSFRDFVGKL